MNRSARVTKGKHDHACTCSARPAALPGPASCQAINKPSCQCTVRYALLHHQTSKLLSSAWQTCTSFVFLLLLLLLLCLYLVSELSSSMIAGICHTAHGCFPGCLSAANAKGRQSCLFILCTHHFMSTANVCLHHSAQSQITQAPFNRPQKLYTCP